MTMAAKGKKVLVESESKLLPFGVSDSVNGINFSFPTDEQIDKIKIYSNISPYEIIDEIDISDYKVADIYSFP